MRVVEEIQAWGHENITAKNKTTFEVTKESRLTQRGDCVIAVRASKGAADLSREFKRLTKRGDARITVVIEADGLKESAVGHGSPSLTFRHPTDLVARRSDYVCDRTLMIRSDKSASNFPRELVRALRDPDQKVRITLIAGA